MTTFLAGHPQVAKVPEALSVLTAPIRAIDGKPTAELTLPAEAAHPVPLVSGSKEIPHGMKLVAGSWFTPADEGRPLLTVKEEVAKSYGLAVGSRIELELEGQPVIFTVASIIAPSGEGVVTTNMGLFTTAPGALDPYSQEYMVTAVTRPGQEEVVVKDLLGQFPSSMPVSLGALMNLLEEVLAKVANILRFVTGFAVAAAGVILSGSLSATQLRRRKEAALLKSLGATRGTVATASALENGLLGAVAGLAGSGLGYAMIQGAAAALQMAITVSPWPLLVATIAGAVMAVLVGLAATVDALQVKPMGILRAE